MTRNWTPNDEYYEDRAAYEADEPETPMTPEEQAEAWAEINAAEYEPSDEIEDGYGGWDDCHSQYDESDCPW